MLQVAGYSIQKSLQDSREGDQTYLAISDSTGAEVLVKRYSSADPEAQQAMIARERDALSLAQGPGVPRVLEALLDQQPPILVVERASGRPLRSIVDDAPLEVSDFLRVAIRVSEILGRMHEIGLVHCRVTPEAIWLDPEGAGAQLIDFRAARVLGAVDHRIKLQSSFEASVLAYASPEQTGRMARGVDARSDLYSLGAVFYLALTGSPPFELEDPLALIHAHMARTPIPPVERRTDLPPTLSRIVQRLLQKEPSDRYQTADALRRDLLECKEQLDRTGAIADELPLGAADIPMRPLFSMRLYGRESEAQLLHEAYARIQEDTAELVLIMGPPGVGKSALIQELRAVLSETGGYLAQGKFDLYRQDVPYSGLIAALETLTHQILGESEARVAMWRESLRRALGNLARVVIDLVPDLEILLPDAPAVPKLGPKETQARLIYTLERLVRGCGQPEHPLVLFIDDLQWADPGSRAVLEALLSQARGTSLLVVTTCRNEREPAWRPVDELARGLVERGVRVTRMELAPLGIEGASQMLADALNREPDEVRGLAEQVASKTGSNPLWIQQFISHIHDLGLIAYSPPNGWIWDEERIAAADVPEGAVGLLVAKLERLPAKPRSVIQFASCVGDEFEIDLLCELTGDPKDALEPALFALAKEGLLAPSPNGFRFVHDRIREAAQELLSKEERSRLHHRTGQHLLEWAPLAAFTERVFELTDHFNRCLDRLSEEERFKTVELNVAAGTRALGAGASQTAASYLAIGRDLFQERDWESGADLGFRLFLHSAEAAFQTLDFDFALELLDRLDRRPLDRMQSASVAARRISCVVAVRPDDAFELTLAEMRRFGSRIPRKVGFLRARLEIEYANWRLSKCLDLGVWDTLRSKEVGWAALALIIGAGGASLVRHGGLMLICVCTSRSLSLFRRHGPLPGATLSLAAFAGMLSSMRLRLNVRDIQRYIDAIATWSERMPSPIDARARFSLHCFTLPYLKPRRALLAPLEEIAVSAFELGDPEYAVYTAGHRAFSLALCGMPLEQVATALRSLSEKHSLGPAEVLMLGADDAYEVLRRPGAAFQDWAQPPPSVAAAMDIELGSDASVSFHWFIVLCHLGHFEVASALLPRFTILGFRMNPVSALDFQLYGAVCRSANAASLGLLGRCKVSVGLRSYLRSVQGRILPEADFDHIPFAVRAECARLEGRTSKALSLYQDASKRAADREYIHHAALIQTRRAELLREIRRSMEARRVFEQAIALYREWGAVAVVQRLERLVNE